jgi:hypothetical protein
MRESAELQHATRTNADHRSESTAEDQTTMYWCCWRLVPMRSECRGASRALPAYDGEPTTSLWGGHHPARSTPSAGRSGTSTARG